MNYKFEDLKTEFQKVLSQPLEGETEIPYVMSFRLAGLLARKMLELEEKKPNVIKVVLLEPR